MRSQLSQYRQIKMRSLIFAMLTALVVSPVHGEVVSKDWACWSQASKKHGVPVNLLKVVAAQESSFNSKAFSKDTNGTFGIGLMQINTWWLKPNAPLGKMGITKEDLWEPCLNLHVGAWILQENFKTYGYNWKAIGAYNAVTEYKRVNYANRIYKRIKKEEFK